MLTLPRPLSETLRFTPEQFAELCAANPDAVLELSSDGQLITMTPTGGETGSRNNVLAYQLGHWARNNPGWKVFDSSTGFRLPDGSVLSPDASALRLSRWQALTPEHRRGFPPLCPDLVIELASPSDEGPRGLTALRRKLASFLTNGARLGWLIIPEQRAVEIWQAGPPKGDQGQITPVEPRRIEPAQVLEAGEILPGLVLELGELWEA
ncbi:MAG: Uma2 family endonuclease [Synechococcus sp. ELA057]|jgi:hypothetical protein